VLVTGAGRQPGQIGGRSPYLQAVHMDGPVSLTGQIVSVKIRGSSSNSLSATLINASPRQERASA
jgi:tRNA-2-methylthio-N6-dimethylallyladenosine synthase